MFPKRLIETQQACGWCISIEANEESVRHYLRNQVKRLTFAMRETINLNDGMEMFEELDYLLRMGLWIPIEMGKNQMAMILK